MELLQLADQGLLPVSATQLDGRNYVLQGLTSTHFINNDVVGDGPFEVIEEYPTSTNVGVDAQAGFVQVMEPSPTAVIVNYLIAPNGSLIPVYDSLPIDNTVTILTEAAPPASETTVPSHMLDHMYAKKPREPGKETPIKPRKRTRKKEPQPPSPIVNKIVMPEIISPNTTKVNIIRKGMVVSSTPNIFRPAISSRPKILQNTKSFINSPQRSVSNSVNDLSSVPSLLSRTSVSSSPSASLTATTPSHDPLRIDFNDAINNSDISNTSSRDTQTSAIYFFPSKTSSSSNVHDIIGSDVVEGDTKAGFIVTTNNETEIDGEQAEQMCILIPSSAYTTSPRSHHSPSKTDGNTTHFDDSTSGQISTFQLNSDGTLTAVPPGVDGTMISYTENGCDVQQLQSENHQDSDVGNEHSICSYSGDMAEYVAMEDSGGAEAETSMESFQFGDNKIFFSYE